MMITCTCVICTVTLYSVHEHCCNSLFNSLFLELLVCLNSRNQTLLLKKTLNQQHQLFIGELFIRVINPCCTCTSVAVHVLVLLYMYQCYCTCTSVAVHVLVLLYMHQCCCTCTYIYSSNPWESNHRDGPTGHKNVYAICIYI